MAEHMSEAQVLATIPYRTGYQPSNDDLVALFLTRGGSWYATGVYTPNDGDTPEMFHARAASDIAAAQEPAALSETMVLLVGYGPNGKLNSIGAAAELVQYDAPLVVPRFFAVNDNQYESLTAPDRDWSSSLPLGQSPVAGTVEAPASSYEGKLALYQRNASPLSAEPTPERRDEILSMSALQRFDLGVEHLQKLGDLDGLGYRPGELAVIVSDVRQRDFLFGMAYKDETAARGAVTAFQHAPDGPHVPDLACLAAAGHLKLNPSRRIIEDTLSAAPPSHELSSLMLQTFRIAKPGAIFPLMDQATDFAQRAVDQLRAADALERSAKRTRASFPERDPQAKPQIHDSKPPTTDRHAPKRDRDSGHER